MTDWKVENLNELARQIMQWRKAKGFRTDWGNVPEKLMLIVSECAEAMEVFRDLEGGYPDDSLPGAEADLGKELADILIRTLDLMVSLGFDTEGCMKRKMDINEKRPFRHGRQR